MAKTSDAPTKEPGRFRQLIDVFKMTAKYDKFGVVLMVGAFVLPIALAVVLCLVQYRTNVVMWIIFVLMGVLFGLLLAMLVLNKRAEKVAFQQLEGRAGAAGAVLSSALRGTWRASEMPVAFNPKTQDVVFRAVGKPGVVLVTEADNAASKRLLNDERRKTQRLLPTVPIHHIRVGEGEGGVPLLELKKALKKLPKALRREEILAVDTRLASLKKEQLPIPKGIDPNRIRPSRSQMR